MLAVRLKVENTKIFTDEYRVVTVDYYIQQWHSGSPRKSRAYEATGPKVLSAIVWKDFVE